jgi:serine/threonine protein kinase/Tol biopolymer transport system component
MLPSGTSVGPYLIQSRISANGPGEVYLAVDQASGNPVAVKLWPASLIKDQNHREWFNKVFGSITRLRHKGICEIYQGGFTEDQQPFVAMEYLRGQTLDMPPIDDELNIAEIVSLVIPIADALEAAHNVGWLHLSIKPANLMLTLSRKVKILDFGQGLAFPLSLSPEVSLESARYLSPEQVLGKPPDRRSDIFSLGAVFYELITGHTPFVGTTVDEVLASVELADPIPMIEFRDSLSTRVIKISEKALARDVKNRYQTAGEFARDLRELGKTRSVILSEQGKIKGRRVLAAASDLLKSVSTIKWKAVTDGAQRIRSQLVTFYRNELSPWILRFKERIPSKKKEAARIIRIIRNRLVTINLFDFIKTNWQSKYLVLLVVVGFLLAIMVSRWLWNSNAINFSESMKISRLTASGGVIDAAISANGNTLVYTFDDGQEQVLMVKDLGSAREKRLTSMSKIEEYRGLQITPDGRLIFYIKSKPEDQWGRSYRLTVNGGAEEEINKGKLTSVLAVSPDGRKLAYLSEHGTGLETSINLVLPEGDERVIAKLSSPAFFIPSGLAWEPEGKMIACIVKDAKSGLYSKLVAINVDTGSESTIVSGLWSEISSIAWQPDGQGLVVSASEPSSHSSQLWHVAYPAGKVRQIIRDLSDYRSVGLMRDPKRLVSVRHETMSNIWVSEIVNLKQSQQLTTGNFDGVNGLAWTPDDRIVYSSLDGGRETLWIGDPKTGQFVELLKFTTEKSEGGEYHPAISADGKQVAFMGARKDGFYLCLSDLRSRNVRRLTDENFMFFPTFAADGKSVISSSLQEGRRVVTRYTTGGGAPERLIDDRAWRPVVSPDGTRIACNYWDVNPWRWNIGVFAIGGGAPQAIFKVPGDAHRVIHWAPGGNEIAYLVTKGGVSNIQFYTLSGNGPMPLSDFKSGRIFNFAWSRDGRRIAFAQGSVKSDVILIQNFTRAQ